MKKSRKACMVLALIFPAFLLPDTFAAEITSPEKAAVLSQNLDLRMKKYLEIENACNMVLDGPGIRMTEAYVIILRILGRIESAYNLHPSSYSNAVSRLELINTVITRTFGICYSDEGEMLLGQSLTEGRLDCDGFATLFELAGEHMGWPIYLVRQKGHMLVWYDTGRERVFYETTTGFPRYDEREVVKSAGPILEMTFEPNADGLAIMLFNPLVSVEWKKEYGMGIELFEHCRPMIPQFSRGWQARFYAIGGIFHEASGDYSRANELLELCISLNSEDTTVDILKKNLKKHGKRP